MSAQLIDGNALARQVREGVAHRVQALRARGVQPQLNVILVGEDGTVENRVIEVPRGLPPSTFVTATNYLSTRFQGKTIAEVAADQGVDPQAVIDALVAEATADIDQRITDMVNGA